MVVQVQKPSFKHYAEKFKALGDQKRLEIIYELSERGQTCVCDLTEIFGMPQSKLSYHLKILLNANLIEKQTKGTWSYYNINEKELNSILSMEPSSTFQKTENKATSNSCC